MKRNNLYLLLLLVSLILVSCKENKYEKREKAHKIDAFLKFPSTMQAYSLNRGYEGIENIEISDKYKIVLYVDSFECTTCYLRLYLWDELIKQANDYLTDKVDFYFFIQPSSNPQDLFYLIKRDKFNYIIYFDNKKEFALINGFPEELNTVCFLLDRNNKIKRIGDPTVDLMIWDQYQEIIINNY